MSTVQIINQVFLFILMCFATILVVIAFQYKGRPWHRGLPGLGGAIFYFGYALNLINGDGLKFDSMHRYDIMCIYLGVIIMSIPRMSLLFRELWHYRPTFLRSAANKHIVSGD